LYLKIKNFVKKFGVLYLIIKVTTTIVRPFNFKLFLKLKAYYFFKKSDVTIGSNVLINTPFFYGDFGKNVIIYSNTIFEFDINSRFTIGNNSVLSYGVLISCSKKIKIGNDVHIGEYTSVRDSSHDYSELGVPMKYNPDISNEINIGNNVWIGRGCMIMPGTIIEDGVVVGANSIVKGHLLANNIYAGSPIKFIKSRI